MRRAVRNLTERVSVLDTEQPPSRAVRLAYACRGVDDPDAGPLLDAAGGLRLDATRKHIEQGTSSARRLRQVLAFPRRGRPVPVVSEDFDIAHHVHARAIPPPADETALLAACAELNERHWPGVARYGRSGC